MEISPSIGGQSDLYSIYLLHNDTLYICPVEGYANHLYRLANFKTNGPVPKILLLTPPQVDRSIVVSGLDLAVSWVALDP